MNTSGSRSLIQAWIDTLRSGRYRQARGRLKRTEYPDGAFCCLGVLCDIYDNGKWSGGVYAGQQNSPPVDIRDNAGLTAADVDDLINLNDNQKLPFTEIADYVEQRILPRATRP